jgi:hypothetical protein
MYDTYEEKAMLAAQQSNQIGQYIPPTARRQLTQKRDMLQQEMDRVDKALEALDSHPELEVFTETLKAALR